MNVLTKDSRFSRIVARNLEVEKLASGFLFTEGPVWHPREHHLVFSDIPGDIMRQWREPDGISTFRKPSHMANGNTYDRQGRMVTCEHATSRVTRVGPGGTTEVLASHYRGKELNSPNDVVVAASGAIYFTDPSFGRMEFFGVPRAKELDFQGVYRIEPKDNALTLLASDFEQPNGLCFSPDENRLYVNDTTRGHIRAFAVAPDGGLVDGRVWVEVKGEGEGAPDGMKTDAEGNVYCTGPGGIHIFDPQGTALGIVLIPEVAANFAFGGADLTEVFVTASTSLYRFRVEIPGCALF